MDKAMPVRGVDAGRGHRSEPYPAAGMCGVHGPVGTDRARQGHSCRTAGRPLISSTSATVARFVCAASRAAAKRWRNSSG